MQKTLLIILTILISTTPTLAQEISCSSTYLSHTEKTICADKQLLKLHEQALRMQLITRYPPFLKEEAEKTSKWFMERDTCETNECIKEKYETLINENIDKLSNSTNYEKELQECRDLNVPNDCEIYLYKGKGLNVDFADFYIDENNETHLEEVFVNRPNKCVFLALEDFEPNVWRIYTTPETKLYGVVLISSRNANQMLQGVPLGTKVFRNKCFLHSQQPPIGVDVGSGEYHELKESVVGEKVDDSKYHYHPQNIDVTATILEDHPNHNGLIYLVKNGFLRHMTLEEAKFIVDSGFSVIHEFGHTTSERIIENFKYRQFSCDTKLGRRTSSRCNLYLVTKEFEYLPKGLNGVYGVNIFVPSDFKAPELRSSSTTNIIQVHAPLKEINAHRKK